MSPKTAYSTSTSSAFLCIWLVLGWSEAAYAVKDDIRGVRVGMKLEEARKIMAKDGGDCSIDKSINAIECKFYENNEISVLYVGRGSEDRVWKIEYHFRYHKPKNEVVAFLKQEYGLVKISQNGIVSGYSTPSGLNAALQPALGSDVEAIFSLYNGNLKAKTSSLPKF